jgi:hypothetical protein
MQALIFVILIVLIPATIVVNQFAPRKESSRQSVVTPLANQSPAPTFDPKLSERNPHPPLVEPSSVSDWHDRFLFLDEYDDRYFSANTKGEEVVEHPFICDGEEVWPVSNVSRSPDGQTIAFVIPQKSARQRKDEWRDDRYRDIHEYRGQGELVIFDLSKNECRKPDVAADYNYRQNVAFSPDGSKLAFVLSGLATYALNTGEIKYLTAHEGSAHFPTAISGPLIWNQSGTAVYMSIHDEIAILESEKKPGYFEKVLIKDGSQVKIMDLPPLLEPRSGWEWDEDEPYPDDPTQYAVSPDERRVAVEENGNLVIKSLASPERAGQIIYDRKQDCYEGEPWGHPYHLTWTRQNLILFETSCCGCGSSMGTTWLSRNGSHAQYVSPEQAHGYALNATQTQLVYSHDFFGDYYIPAGQPQPVDFESSGHRYDGLGVLNLLTGKWREFEGKDVIYGAELVWF